MGAHDGDLIDTGFDPARAVGLSNRHYIDPAMHATETARLLRDQWAGLAVAADVPESGDARPIEFMGMPLLLLRGHDSVVRVFQNVCRHRGMILVDAPRRVEGALRCPYHSWCYRTDGALVATPHVGGPGQNRHDGIDRATLGLIEVRSHIWRDIVWINISGDAPPFTEAMAPLLERWREVDTPLHHGGESSRWSLTLAANWKLAVENYCESYHLPWVHPGLNSYSRLEDHYNIEADGAFSGQGTRVYRQLTDAHGARFPDFAGLSTFWDEAAEYVAVYPNVLLGQHRDHAFAIILTPLAVNRTREDIHLYYASPETDAVLRNRNAEQWQQVFSEDIAVVEGMQRGRHAPGFDGGRFSPVMDGPTRLFHAWAADRLEPDPPG